MQHIAHSICARCGIGVITKEKMSMQIDIRNTLGTHIRNMCVQCTLYIVECTVSASSCSSYFCEASATVSSFFLSSSKNELNHESCNLRTQCWFLKQKFARAITPKFTRNVVYRFSFHESEEFFKIREMTTCAHSAHHTDIQ